MEAEARRGMREEVGDRVEGTPVETVKMARNDPCLRDRR